MRNLGILACSLWLAAATAHGQAAFPNQGVIYGTAIAPGGTRAKELTLNAAPLGAPLSMALPWTKTNNAGAFRFEHLPMGRYSVFAEDEEQGYSSFSTGPAGPGKLPQVELTTQHPEAKFNVHLPPKAGFLIFHLTNQRTDAAIPAIQVTVMSAKSPSTPIFSGGYPSNRPVLVPSNKVLLLHVTSWGFREWGQSVGHGKPVRIAPGHRLTMDVQLNPFD
jgi:hypothetical protein